MGKSRYIKEFGLILFLINGISRLIRKFVRNSVIINAYDRFKHKIDSYYLYIKYGYLLQTSKEVLNNDLISIEGKNYTFVFWWQGLDNAPEIVKLCIQSAKKHEKNIVILDMHNYKDWVVLPDYIIDKFEKGYISIAHFSDIIRFYLLYVYGGTWMDATCFLSKSIPNNIKSSEFWSINGAFRDVLNWRWTSFFMCGKSGNIVAEQMLSFYYEYWRKHDCALTYLFLDCWLTVLCQHDKRICKIIDSLPDSGYKVFKLISSLNEVYTPALRHEMENTFFVYKLTYKENFKKMRRRDITLYGHLLSEYL